MNRSAINKHIEDSIRFFNEHQFFLPKWGYWSPDKWKQNKGDCQAVFDHMLGWDLTDFGSGDFLKRGLTLFTLRNGHPGKNDKDYCEKIMIVEEHQETPLHFHWSKMEDIINRGGGNLVFELYNSNPDEALRQDDVVVKIDEIPYRCKAGEQVILEPGQSMCLEKGLYHRFYGEKGRGKVLVGEVSRVNDDVNDNRFHEPLGRFPEIEEDEAPAYLLVNDYKKFGLHG